MYEYEDEIDICATERERIEDIEEINSLNLNNKLKIKNLKILHSKIINLKGIQDFKNLTSLDLSSNKITSINIYLKSMKVLKTLSISCNLLTNVSGIEYLTSLEEVNLSHNKITTIDAFNLLSDSSQSLRLIDLKDNLIQNLNQVVYLQGLSNLEILILAEREGSNPICAFDNYYDFIRDTLPQLKQLDGGDINCFEFNNKIRSTHYTSHGHNRINTANTLNRYNNNNNRTQDIKYKNFMKTAGSSGQHQVDNRPKGLRNINRHQEEIKNLQNNIEELFQDQKELVLKYEQNENYWKSKLEEVQENLRSVKSLNNTLHSKHEEKELMIRELMNKLSLKDHEIDSFKRLSADLELKLQDANNKHSMLKKDYEYAMNDSEKGLKKINEMNKEINELKDHNKNLKENLSKEENFYKDLSQKKSDEVNEKIRTINNMEHKIYEVNRLLADKQKEIENLIERNNSLQNNLMKLNKDKNDNEFDLKNKFDREKDDLVNKYKSSIDDLEINFKKLLQNKQDEFVRDMNEVVKTYEEEKSKLENKIFNLVKENERTTRQFEDCKELLKQSLQNEEKNENVIKELEKLNTQFHIEKENYKTKYDLEKEASTNKIKYMEVEIKDQNEQILKLDNAVRNLKQLVGEKEKEVTTSQDDLQRYIRKIAVLDLSIDKLQKELEYKDDEIENLKNLMNSDPNVRKIEELNEVIRTKNMMLDDHTNQILELKGIISAKEMEFEKFKSKKEKEARHQDKVIQGLRNEFLELESIIKSLEQKNNEAEENMSAMSDEIQKRDVEITAYKSKLLEKDEVTKRIQDDMFDLKQFYEHNKSLLKEKNDEVKLLLGNIEELNHMIQTKDSDIREILEHFDSYKKERDMRVIELEKVNQELHNDLLKCIQEYDEHKLKLKASVQNLTSMF
jgi:chromosome segregation ATPase